MWSRFLMPDGRNGYLLLEGGSILKGFCWWQNRAGMDFWAAGIGRWSVDDAGIALMASNAFVAGTH